MNFKVTTFPDGDKNEKLAELEKLKRDLPLFLEYCAISAQIKRASYEAHIKQGFTPDQALELCKSLV
jgi:hypothetical protein